MSRSISWRDCVGRLFSGFTVDLKSGAEPPHSMWVGDGISLRARGDGRAGLFGEADALAEVVEARVGAEVVEALVGGEIRG
jgi:hypothetical protein